MGANSWNILEAGVIIKTGEEYAHGSGEDTKLKMQQDQELKQHNWSGNLCRVHGGRGNLMMVNIPSPELTPLILTSIRLLKWYDYMKKTHC